MYTLQMIHVDVWQKSIQHCETIILQLKINLTTTTKRMVGCPGILSSSLCTFSTGKMLLKLQTFSKDFVVKALCGSSWSIPVKT